MHLNVRDFLGKKGWVGGGGGGREELISRTGNRGHHSSLHRLVYQARPSRRRSSLIDYAQTLTCRRGSSLRDYILISLGQGRGRPIASTQNNRKMQPSAILSAEEGLTHETTFWLLLKYTTPIKYVHVHFSLARVYLADFIYPCSLQLSSLIQKLLSNASALNVPK